MKALLVRVAADQSRWGGRWNGPVDSRTGEFVYVPIPDDGPFHPGLATPYSNVAPHLTGRWPRLPAHLDDADMHLDPDFAHLTYGDQGSRAAQIREKLTAGDLLVFYAGLADIVPSPRLVYGLIGLFVIGEIVDAALVPPRLYHQNAHTRRSLTFSRDDIVVRARAGVSGRLTRCIPIGSYRSPTVHPEKRPCYRVSLVLLETWGGLNTTDGFLQRSGRLPEFLDADRFYAWFLAHNSRLIGANNGVPE